MDPIAGLLSPDDRRRSRNMGLLAAGFSLMGGDEDLLSNIGNAGLMGVQAYMGSNERALEAQQLRQQQMAQIAAQRQAQQQQEMMQQAAQNLVAQSSRYTDAQRRGLGVLAQANPSAVLDMYMAQEFPERDVRVVGDNLVDAASGNVVYEKGPDPLLPTTAEERYAYRKAGVPINTPSDQLTPEQIASITAGQREYTDLRANNTQVTIQGPDSGRQFDLVVDALQDGRTQARTAVNEIMKIDDALKLLDDGNVNLGRTANLSQTAQEWLAGAGLIDGERVANTQQLLMTLRSRALNFIQSFPGQLSEKELEAAQFLAGDITMTPQSLRRALESARVLAEKQIAEHNREVDDIWGDNPQLRRFLRVNPGAYLSNPAPWTTGG